MSSCDWTQDDDWGMWETSCGHAFDINEGKPSENNMIFCCFCGDPLIEHEFVEEDIDV